MAARFARDRSVATGPRPRLEDLSEALVELARGPENGRAEEPAPSPSPTVGRAPKPRPKPASPRVLVVVHLAAPPPEFALQLAEDLRAIARKGKG